MKFCPTCQTRYEEEIMRFCTKDGSPLVEDAPPNFIEMPSESLANADEDDFGAETVIRRKTTPIANVAETPKERLVIPTVPPVEDAQQVRTKTVAAYQPPPPKKTTMPSEER